MNDQSPFTTGVRFEDRSDYTFLTEKQWDNAVTSLVARLDAALSRENERSKDQTVQSLHNWRKKTGDRKKEVSAPRRANSVYEPLREAVLAWLKANTMQHPGSVAEQFRVSESFVRRQRAALGLPKFHTGKNLPNRMAELLAKSPELTDEALAERLGATKAYIVKLRLRLRKAEKASQTAEDIKGDWDSQE